jgi:5-methylcytosine-specific restriction enzyme A
MNTFLFIWNPKKWPWNDLPQAVYEANAEGRYVEDWSCAATRDISIGDRAFLMRLGVSPKGIMGSGIIISEPYEGLDWREERAKLGGTIYKINILFDVLSDLPILSEEELISPPFPKYDWCPPANARHIPKSIANLLESAWLRATGTTFDQPETMNIKQLRLEGTKRTYLVTKYERDPKAREECLKNNGTLCQVCGFSFEVHYGAMGRGFIHVHHIVPVSEIGVQYEVDPINDLRSVCPNCHAMLHKRTPPFTIQELKDIIKERNNL